jgi:hypothetical protein
MPIVLSVGWMNDFQSVERHSHVTCPGYSRTFESGVSMTHDFLDSFTRTEIAYRQGKVFADWALPGRRRTRAYTLKAPKKAVASPTRTGFSTDEDGVVPRLRRRRLLLLHWRRREEPAVALVVPWSEVRATDPGRFWSAAV